MTKIILSGCNGKMGQAVARLAESREDTGIIFGVDIYAEKKNQFEVYSEFPAAGDAGVIIDFSNPNALDGLLSYAIKTNTPVVLCSTGYYDEQLRQIDDASKKIPIFKSGNMSLGINLLIELAKKATAVLSADFDIEIIEKHHNTKIDAPSGTAVMIADGISEALDKKPQLVYDRHSYRKARSKNEIGIHAIRGGTIVGEHDVLFAGKDETVTLSHTAGSKDVFAVGALNAAVFLEDKPAGMYSMSDLLSEKLEKI